MHLSLLLRIVVPIPSICGHSNDLANPVTKEVVVVFPVVVVVVVSWSGNLSSSGLSYHKRSKLYTHADVHYCTEHKAVFADPTMGGGAILGFFDVEDPTDGLALPMPP